MSTAIEIRDLPSRLNEVLALAESGAEVILTEGSVPRARIVPVGPTPTAGARIPGLHKGAIETSDDFDDPLPDEFWGGEP
jgi:antitoxin (DNA-binding transcriptional repressor) of toxin-antitoxin stability system